MLRTATLALLAALVASLALAVSAGAATKNCPTALDQRGATGVVGDTPVNQSRAVTLLFIPGPVRTPQPDLAQYLQLLPGYSVGLFSPTLGRYSPTQMMLDISQGARVASGLYKPVTPPPPGLVRLAWGGGRLDPWRPLVARADAVPGEIVPGLLGCAIGGAGRSSAWYGFDDSPTITSIAAATTAGGVASVGVAPRMRIAQTLLAAQRVTDLVVAAVPAGGPGLGVARELAARTPQRMIIIVQSPPEPARTRLLSYAIHGVGGPGGLRSATTRRDGLVSATDFAPTILDRMRVSLPSAIQGQPIEPAKWMSASQLAGMSDRLSLVAGRRAPLARSMLVLCGLIVILLLLLGRITGRYEELARLSQRLVGLGVMYVPLMLLITAVLRPSRQTEVDLAVLGAMLLAFVTDRFVAWPRALAVPAAAAIVAHGIDFLAFGGVYTGESLLGSNPLYGARFFGVGNELEALLTVSCVIGTGAILSDSGVRRPERWFIGVGVLLALFLGAGRLGADVGGVIFAAAAFGIAALYQARTRLTPGRVALLVLVPIAGLALIAGLDALTGGQSHLTRTVIDAHSTGDLVKVADRRFRASIDGAKPTAVWTLLIIALAMLAWGWVRRERLFSRLADGGDDPEPRRPYRAGMVGALGGTIVGALANDSGPAILIIGTVVICMGLLYLRGRPISGTVA